MSIGNILGGALQGIGAGMTKKAVMDIEDRRQQALEALRTTNAKNEIAARGEEQRRTNVEQADLTDRNNARQVQRTTSASILTDNNKSANDIKLQGVKFANDKDLARFKAGLDQANDAASQRLKADIDAGQVKQIVDGGDGYYYSIYADGRREMTGVPTVPKPIKDRRGNVTTPEANPVIAPQRDPGFTGASKTPVGTKILNSADVADYAKQTGMSVEDVTRALRAKGYVVRK